MDDLSTNRAHWDALARVHGQDSYYDTASLVAGADALEDAESAAVGDVAGLDLLHLQSHIAFDSISLARGGAHVTCVDFSPESLAAAGHLADRCGVALELVEADAAALPSTPDGRFDMVYAAIGVLGWIADVAATATVEYAHSLGEVVTAAIGAGLRIDALHEHLDVSRDGRGRGRLAPDHDGRFRLRVSGELLPLQYTLLAGRPA